jgi:V/A-type H+-transporting ATPase subunit K
MKKKIAASALALLSAASAFAQSTGAAPSASSASAWKYIGAAVAVSVACLAGGIAVARIGAAAMGAMAEKPELSGKALPYVGLAEGICLWGFLVALLILLL